MRKIAMIALALALAGCATFKPLDLNTTVSRNTLVGIESGYGIVLSGERTYKSLCVAKSIPVTCRAVVVRLQAADRKTAQAIHAAAKFISTFPTVDASNVISAAQSALDELRSILGSTGVI